jgi:hypothetical protein
MELCWPLRVSAAWHGKTEADPTARSREPLGSPSCVRTQGRDDDDTVGPKSPVAQPVALPGPPYNLSGGSQLEQTRARANAQDVLAVGDLGQ